MNDEQNESPESAEAFGLMIQLFEEQLDQSGVDRLDALICQHVEIRLQYIQVAHQYCTLMPLVAGLAAEADAPLVDDADVTAADLPSSMAIPQALPQPVAVGRDAWIRLALISTAAMLILGFVLTWALSRNPSNAVLIADVDAAWNINLKPGQDLPNDPITLNSGLAKIQVKDGTLVIVEGPATFQVSNPGEVKLTAGSMTATVPVSAHGFAISTPSAHVVDLGTEFGVSVNPDSSTYVSVFRGKVETRAVNSASAASASPTTLIAGEAAEVSSHSVTPASANLKLFARSDELDDRIAEQSLPVPSRWRTFSYQLRRDPSLVVYYTFDKHEGSATTVINEAETGSAFDGVIGSGNGTPPARVAGRWADKSAIVFQSEALQYVQITTSPKLDFATAAPPARPLSVVAWVNAEVKQGPDVSIFTYGKGLHEQYAVGIFGGRFRAWIRSGPDDAGTNTNGPVVTTGWHQLVLTVNPAGNSMALYFDGAPTEMVKIPNTLLQTPPVPGLLGARISRADKYIPSFNGAVDELAVFSRALPADEVAKLYAAEKP